MSSKNKIQIKVKQKLRRRQRRLKLLKAGLDPKDFFYEKYYIHPSNTKEEQR